MYDQDAQVLLNAAQAIKESVQEHGMGTATTMVILGQLLNVTRVASNFMDLPQDQRDEFFAALFDAAIGNEPNALVNKVGLFQGETLEQLSDAMKAGFLAYMNRTAPALPAAGGATG